MSPAVASLAAFAGQNPFWAYFIVYAATIFFGNISAFASFWIALRGNLGEWSIPLLLLIVFLANVSGDLLWYSLGRVLHNTAIGNWIRDHIPGHDRIERSLQNHGRRWMFLAKFFYASSFPVVFSIGWTGIEFRRFIRNSFLATCMWLPILLGLAYGLISGLSPLTAIDAFKHFEWLFLIGLALFILLDYLLAKLIRFLFARRNNGMNDASSDEVDEPDF